MGEIVEGFKTLSPQLEGGGGCEDFFGPTTIAVFSQKRS